MKQDYIEPTVYGSQVNLHSSQQELSSEARISIYGVISQHGQSASYEWDPLPKSVFKLNL